MQTHTPHKPAKQSGVYTLFRTQEQRQAQEEAALCKVCFFNPKSVLLIPCGHLCLCRQCSDEITVRIHQTQKENKNGLHL